MFNDVVTLIIIVWIIYYCLYIIYHKTVNYFEASLNRNLIFVSNSNNKSDRKITYKWNTLFYVQNSLNGILWNWFKMPIKCILNVLIKWSALTKNWYPSFIRYLNKIKWDDVYGIFIDIPRKTDIGKVYEELLNETVKEPKLISYF